MPVAVGVGYMIAIDDEGKAFSWGYNPFNQCGRGFRDVDDSDENDGARTVTWTSARCN